MALSGVLLPKEARVWQAILPVSSNVKTCRSSPSPSWATRRTPPDLVLASRPFHCYLPQSRPPPLSCQAPPARAVTVTSLLICPLPGPR